MNLGLNFKAVFASLIPLSFRSAKITDWMGANLAPLQSLNETFADWADGIRYNVSFTGQVIYLEHALNDRYDSTLRRIYIEDPSGTQVLTTTLYNQIEQQAQTIMWNKAEAQPSPIFRNLAEVFTTGDDFIVKIPSAINTTINQAKMRRLIDRYRTAGKRYSFSNI